MQKPKKHDYGFEETKGSDEDSFPFILLLDADVVVSPLDVELVEESGVLHVINQLRNERERVPIMNGVAVKIVIILTRTNNSILLRDKEEWSSLWGLGRNYSPSL